MAEIDTRRTTWLGTWWLSAFALLAVAFWRWQGAPDHPLAIGLVGVTPVVLALAWPMILVAVCAQQHVLLGISLCLAVLHLSWTLDDLNVRSSVAGANEEGSIRIATANLWVGNNDQPAAVAALLDHEPDVIFLQEVQPGAESAIFALPALASYEWRASTGSVGERGGRGGRLVLSRLPLTNLRVDPFTNSSLMVRADLAIDDAIVEIHNVHVAAPNNGGAGLWREQLALIDEWHRTRTGPMIVAGDFNATVHHRQFRLLLDGGMLDGHARTGSGLGFSWAPLGAPLMRLDHVLVSSDLELTSTETLPRMGSDHRPIITTVRRP